MQGNLFALREQVKFSFEKNLVKYIKILAWNDFLDDLTANKCLSNTLDDPISLRKPPQGKFEHDCLSKF